MMMILLSSLYVCMVKNMTVPFLFTNYNDPDPARLLPCKVLF